VSGKRFDVRVLGDPIEVVGAVAGNGGASGRREAQAQRTQEERRRRRRDELVSPLQGNMWKVQVEEGQTVEEASSSASSRR
jgi:biotin carboxyl carrier protein